MVVRLRRLSVSAALILTATGMTQTAWGQTPPTTTPPQATNEDVTTTLEAFEEAFFNSTGTFYENRGIPGNVTWFLGPYPENNISRDARRTHEVYNQVMTEQALSDPLLRTPDLANPFDTSLLLFPATQALTRPQEAPAIAPAVVEAPPVPVATPQSPPQPVRALF